MPSIDTGTFFWLVLTVIAPNVFYSIPQVTPLAHLLLVGPRNLGRAVVITGNYTTWTAKKPRPPTNSLMGHMWHPDKFTAGKNMYTVQISYRSKSSDIDFGISRSLKVKSDCAVVLQIYDFLLVYNNKKTCGLTKLFCEIYTCKHTVRSDNVGKHHQECTV